MQPPVPAGEGTSHLVPGLVKYTVRIFSRINLGSFLNTDHIEALEPQLIFAFFGVYCQLSTSVARNVR